jgi:hypothetical protein
MRPTMLKTILRQFGTILRKLKKMIFFDFLADLDFPDLAQLRAGHTPDRL